MIPRPPWYLRPWFTLTLAAVAIAVDVIAVLLKLYG